MEVASQSHISNAVSVLDLTNIGKTRMDGGSKKYTSVFGEAWVMGRHLWPRLRGIGAGQYDVVLDLACGTSPFKGLFLNAEEYIRIDRLPTDNDVIAADMRSIPLADSSVNLVILSQALSDVPIPLDVLEELARVLIDGGHAVVIESMCYPEHDMPYDYYRLMPAGLAWMAEKAGFEVEECIYLGGFFTRVASLWADYAMGMIGKHKGLRWLAALGVAVGNVTCAACDRLVMRRSLASDYFMILRSLKRRESHSVENNRRD